MAKFAAKRGLEERRRKAVMREALAEKECSLVRMVLQNQPASIREIADKTGLIYPDRIRHRLHQLGAQYDDKIGRWRYPPK
jgi:hypothetical protein